MSRYTDKAINRTIGQAIHAYDMIQHGDVIAVGISGGADSFSLWRLLHERRRRAPVDYRVLGLHIDLGFGAQTGEHIAAYAQRQGFEFHWEQSDIGPLAHTEKNTENPCFLCARLRRKRLFELYEKLGCTKLALGHHKDDIIETLFINMCYIGEMSTMVPKQELFKGAVTIIRPLAYTEKKAIKRFARDHSIPVIKSGCPTDGHSKRSHFREILAGLYKTNKKIKSNIFRAMHKDRINLEYLLR